MRTCESYVTVKQNITFATSRMMAESPGSGLPAAMRYLVKDVDFFAGFAHAIHTYLGGVALAHANHMRLLHVPFQSAHGLGYAFDDFLAGDERGLVAPLSAPVLTSDAHGRLYASGRWTNVSTISRAASQATIAQRLRSAPPDSITWVHKGRFAFADADPTLCVNCTQTAEARYTALWLRERFWRAVRAREQQQQQLEQQAPAVRSRRGRTTATAAAPPRRLPTADAAASSVEPIVVAVHVRRGDVTYLDRYGKPSARWVQTSDMLEVLKGVRDVLGTALAPPRVQVHLFSEAKGWGHNDTEALHELAPSAAVHLDSNPTATIDALVTMSRSDILLMGSSGFSSWSAIFSCGVKIGARHLPMMPMRHVAYSNTLTARSGPFATAALPRLREVWGSYWGCKSDPACRPTLCAPAHLSDSRWAQSGLARECVARADGAQWRVPTQPPSASAGAQTGSAGGDGRSIDVAGWQAARQACLLRSSVATRGRRDSSLVACLRSTWHRNLTSSLSLKQRLAAAAARAAAAGSSSSSITPLERVSPRAAAPAAVSNVPRLLPTKVEVRDGKTFLDWAP